MLIGNLNFGKMRNTIELTALFLARVIVNCKSNDLICFRVSTNENAYVGFFTYCVLRPILESVENIPFAIIIELQSVIFGGSHFISPSGTSAVKYAVVTSPLSLISNLTTILNHRDPNSPRS